MNERTNERTNEAHAVPCAEPRCPALATVDDYCAVHAQGLRRHHVPAEDDNTLRCARCACLIRDGEWYRSGATIEHVKACIAKELRD